MSNNSQENKKWCLNCKWMNQAEGSCRCFNPKQDDESLKNYVYYNFDCKLFERGKQLTIEEMKKLGYELKDSEDGYKFYQKIES